VPGYHVNGALTLGENIGDNSGLAIAYKAYKISLHGKPAPVIDGLTGDQRFFMGFGQVWRSKMRDEAADQPGQDRPALAGPVPRQRHPAQPGRLLRSLRRQGRRQDVPEAGRARHDLVIPGQPETGRRRSRCPIHITLIPREMQE
jgi:hypothetical protein